MKLDNLGTDIVFPRKIEQIIGAKVFSEADVNDLICENCVDLVNSYDRTLLAYLS